MFNFGNIIFKQWAENAWIISVKLLHFCKLQNRGTCQTSQTFSIHCFWSEILHLFSMKASLIKIKNDYTYGSCYFIHNNLFNKISYPFTHVLRKCFFFKSIWVFLIFLAALAVWMQLSGAIAIVWSSLSGTTIYDPIYARRTRYKVRWAKVTYSKKTHKNCYKRLLKISN